MQQTRKRVLAIGISRNHTKRVKPLETVANADGSVDPLCGIEISYVQYKNLSHQDQGQLHRC